MHYHQNKKILYIKNLIEWLSLISRLLICFTGKSLPIHCVIEVSESNSSSSSNNNNNSNSISRDRAGKSETGGSGGGGGSNAHHHNSTTSGKDLSLNT
jgi:uncharacterized membrane protein YgcG